MTTRAVLTTYKWRINNFNQQIAIVEGGGSISSDVFSLNGNSKAKFSMKLKRKGTDNCAVYLVCKDFGRKQEMQLDAKIWVEFSEVFGPKYDSKLTFNKASIINLLVSGYSPSNIKKVVIGDVIFIYCEIEHEELISEFDESDSEDDKEELIAHREFTRKSLALRLNGQIDGTVTIQTEDKEFKANKLDLMACSDVFYRMFSCANSTEAKTGIVKIEDTKPEIINALVSWIYQVEVENMEDVAMDLYRAADKYDICFLKKKCIKTMTKSLSNENFAPRLLLAYKFNEEQFKNHIFNFFRKDNKRWKHLVKSNEWMELCSEDPEEAKKIVDEIPD